MSDEVFSIRPQGNDVGDAAALRPEPEELELRVSAPFDSLVFPSRSHEPEGEDHNWAAGFRPAPMARKRDSWWRRRAPLLVLISTPFIFAVSFGVTVVLARAIGW